jgi:hypothetical protein
MLESIQSFFTTPVICRTSISLIQTSFFIAG